MQRNETLTLDQLIRRGDAALTETRAAIADLVGIADECRASVNATRRAHRAERDWVVFAGYAKDLA